MNFVDFEVENIGKFRAQVETTMQQRFELEREIDEFFGGKLAILQARASKLEDIVKANMLAEHFKGKLLGELSSVERTKFDKLWPADDSVERRAAEAINFRLNEIRMTFRLDKVLIEKPADMGLIRDLTDYGLFMRIWLAYGAAIAPFRETDAGDSGSPEPTSGGAKEDSPVATKG